MHFADWDSLPDNSQDNADAPVPDADDDLFPPDATTSDVACSTSAECPPMLCQVASCDAKGTCLYNLADEGTSCDDSDPCTSSDACHQGTCSGTPVLCEPPTVCVESTCNPSDGTCLHTPIQGPCDDSDPCTFDDHCDQGLCIGEPLLCADDNPCTYDSCLPNVGCAHTAMVGLPCTSTSPCAQNLTCQEDGSCSAGTPVTCDDHNPCTQDSCLETDGSCQHLALTGTPCSDDNACTQGDTCSNGLCVGESILCDDGNLCTQDTCQPGSGCAFLSNTLPCDDSNPCTENDRCASGKCQNGTPKDCSDGNPCTLDQCDPETGTCSHSFVDWPCSDNNLCTTQDRCINGACVGVAMDCRDTNPCTSDSCDLATGCIHTPVSAPCEDGNLCTLGDYCSQGACQPGPSLPQCQDDNPCTADSCSPASGLCLHTPVAGSCDDGNPCTLGDSCSAGVCVPGSNDWCECSSDLDCAPLDDDNQCNGVLHCDTTLWPYRCRILPDSVVTCPTNFDTQCRRMKCQPQSGTCLLVPELDGLSCDDDNLCTTSDVCTDGECLPQQVVSCDDPNPCVITWCDPLFGCQYQPNNVPCDDHNPCTTGDRCSIGFCQGIAVYCEDGNPCTFDFCDTQTGTCTYFNSTGACNDNNACTVQDSCSNGVCLGQPRDCDDGKPCTSDSCTPPAGCSHTILSGECDDSNACTQGDTCQGALCQGTQVVCNDDNPCTSDSCNPLTGCQFVNNTSPCDDQSFCTANDRCLEGHCEGTPINCDDGNPCTDHDCHPFAGCLLWNLDVACNDGNQCTTGDWCVDGVCLAGTPTYCDDGSSCTLDYCDEQTGLCSYLPLASACDDGSFCTRNDHCDKGTCVGEAVQCGDSNPCTADSCNPSVGCLNNPMDGSWCTDGDSCTVGDLCQGSVCTSGAPQECDDEDPCTLDDCQPAIGCTHDPITQPPCLFCGPALPLDGHTVPSPQQLQISLDDPCFTPYDLVPGPQPSLELSATLPDPCATNQFTMVATVPLPQLSGPYRLALQFHWDASLCLPSPTQLASFGLLTPSTELELFSPEVTTSSEACGTHVGISAADALVSVELLIDPTEALVQVWRDGVELEDSPWPLDPANLPTHTYFRLHSGTSDGQPSARITWYRFESLCD